MATKIRLARGGSKKRPFYRIVVADERAPRDGNFIEKIGNFNPMVPKDHKERVVISKERAEHWLKVGAQPTERIQRILSELGMMDAPKITEKTKKHLPKAKAQERVKAKEEAALKAEEDAKAAAEAAKAEAEKPTEETPAVTEEQSNQEEATPDVAAEEAPAAETPVPAEEAATEETAAPTEEAPAEPEVVEEKTEEEKPKEQKKVVSL